MYVTVVPKKKTSIILLLKLRKNELEMYSATMTDSNSVGAVVLQP